MFLYYISPIYFSYQGHSSQVLHNNTFNLFLLYTLHITANLQFVHCFCFHLLIKKIWGIYAFKNLQSWLTHFVIDDCFSRALHWVTIQMLCVPVDEEIPEVSDSVVKAITGETAEHHAIFLS